MYCKEIIRQMDRIPVYIPGRKIELGDVIIFPNNKNRPIGDYQRETNLKNFGIEFADIKDESPDPYDFSSKRGVSFTFNPEVNAGNPGKGELDITFSKEGASFLKAIKCTEHSINDVTQLKEDLRPYQGRLDWGNYFIVYSITVAERALIMQSASSSGGLKLKGDVKGFQVGSTENLSAGINFEITFTKDAAFLKDWSPDVAVFMRLVRYHPNRNKLVFESNEDIYDMSYIDPAMLLEEG
ncbi:hypothetical protein CRP01_40875 [Flavilitoribacter nigricans DSM 23189 = NBRC 102662]|uniref:Uncharacterized protein n=2 Tax=Flavilitoribacter TaxID=2762562 RepID=A0A2D0MX01_FLAN2|nr:hypothetical protein CRP01_40875 [Flavilitoribacter nigricans DSM 23189 = NBRC 102662]